MKFELKKNFPFRTPRVSRQLLKVFQMKRPKDATLDRLALLTGFQSWEDLQETLRGETDGQVNISQSPRHRQLKSETNNQETK